MGIDAPSDSAWEELPLSALTSANITYGVVQPGTSVGDGVPMVRVNNFSGHSLRLDEVVRISRKVESKYERTRIQGGDVLITVVGSVGQVAIVPPELRGWNIARAVALIRPNAPGLSRWIAYFLRSPIAQHRMGIAANTTVQTTVNLKDLRSMLVPMPPESIRRGISELLGALDDRIDLLRQTNTTLEATAQALFKSWFVDFDPVHAKAEGREPEAMDAATAALFPSEFEESELGPIPKGWRVDEIGNVVKCLGGGTPSTKNDVYWVDGEHHWVTPKDLAGLQAPILTATSRRITDAGLSRISSGLLPRGTLLMSSRAPIGYLAVAGIPTAINQGFIAMPPGGTLPPVYLFFWTRTNMDSIKQKANGSTFMEISKSAFRPIELCVPPPELVDAFVAIASTLMDRIEANEHHRVSLTDLRDTLLPRLISGKLRLPEATEAAEAALV
jgi:type I restriction enzyme S subunit